MNEVRRRIGRLMQRGILALDTADAVQTARFRAAGMAPAPATADAYLRMVLATPELAARTSGVVLRSAALLQAPALRTAGILPGVRADGGPAELAGRGRVTTGLDGLHSRLPGLRLRGAEFAVWSVCTPLPGEPLAMQALTENSVAAATFARTCQDNDMIPLLRVGTRMAPAAPDVRRMALAYALISVIGHLEDAHVDLAATVVTVPCDPDPGGPVDGRPLTTLPRELGGVALCPAPTGSTPGTSLPGMTRAAIAATLPATPHWPVTFYLGRDASLPALRAWGGVPAQRSAAHQVLRTSLVAAACALPGSDNHPVHEPG